MTIGELIQFVIAVESIFLLLLFGVCGDRSEIGLILPV